jgi:aryl-alcohol dehydrogenase-like predicted oxidoreductase
VEYTHLGRSGLSVSRLCLGTMNFGWRTADADF